MPESKPGFWKGVLKRRRVTELEGRGKQTPNMMSPTVDWSAPNPGPYIKPYPTDVMGILMMVNHAPVASAIRLNIRNEVWRKDLKLIPKWGAKCDGCGREYEDGLERLRDKMLGVAGGAGALSGGKRNPRPRPGDGAGAAGGGAIKSCPRCGYTWSPRAAAPVKCPKCDTVLRKGFEEETQPESESTDANGVPGEQADVICEDCGGVLRAPDMEQKKKWEGFEHRPNMMGMDFHQVAETLEDDVNVFDDAYMIFRYAYSEDADTGEVVTNLDTGLLEKELVEVKRGEPQIMRIVIDDKGRRGKYAAYSAEKGSGYYTCLFHRKDNVKAKGEKCPECGREMIPCEYISLGRNGQPELGFIDDEVFHWSKYSPSETYGFSPWLTCWSEVVTLTNISRLASTIYQQYRPPKGYLIFRTRNMEALQTQFQQIEEKLKVNPVEIPKIAVDSEMGERFVEWLPLTQDWQELQTIPLMKELRERIEAVFGVSNIMMGDTSSSGGLNNEGLQITVTLRTIERAQYLWSYKVLPVLLDRLGITDWKLKFPPPVEEDRMAVLERRRVNLELMGTAMEMQETPGVQIVDEEDFAFRLTAPLTQPRGMMGMGGGPVPGDPRNPNSGGKNIEDFKNVKPRGEVTGKIPGGPGGEGARKAASSDDPFLNALLDALYSALDHIALPEEAVPDAVKASVDGFIAEARAKFMDATLSEYASHILSGVQDIIPGAQIDTNAIAALQAKNGLLWGSYADIGAEISGEMNRRIVEAFVKPEGFDVDKIKRELKAVVNDIVPSRLENIARSEALLMVNTGREMAYRATEEPGDLYTFEHTGDFRECDHCSRAVRRIGDGKTLDQIREIIDDEARRKNGPRWVTRGWLVHPQCRGLVMRVGRY